MVVESDKDKAEVRPRNILWKGSQLSSLLGSLELHDGKEIDIRNNF